MLTTTTPTTPRTRTRKRPESLTPADRLRIEILQAEREKLERAYWLRVVLPLNAQGYPRPEPQAMIVPGRLFAFDYAWQIDGAIWRGSRGGHTSGTGHTRDCEKANEAVCAGWRVLRFTEAQITHGFAMDWTERALRASGLRTAR
jgi:hypothetical protein